MKKLLGIVVLGLLWSSASFAETNKITTYQCKEYLTRVEANGEPRIWYTDDVATLIVNRSNGNVDNWGSPTYGEAELIYKNKRRKFILGETGYGDSFIAYKYSKIDNERIKNTDDLDTKKVYKKNKGKIANLEFLHFNYEDSPIMFDLKYIINSSLWTIETDINQMRPFVFTFFCKE